MRLPGRLDGLARRVSSGTGLQELLGLGHRVEALEEAVAENAALLEPLAEQVTRLERSLVEPMEHHLDQVRSQR